MKRTALIIIILLVVAIQSPAFAGWEIKSKYYDSTPGTPSNPYIITQTETFSERLDREKLEEEQKDLIKEKRQWRRKVLKELEEINRQLEELINK